MVSLLLTGTWSRSSTVIGPRRPFAKDLGSLDYSYDSGEEWEEEEEGDEVVSDGEDGEEISSDEDSLDGWLVGDDEDVGGEVIDHEMATEEGISLTNKRKTGPTKQALPKEKKRRIAPLDPFSKGPLWEAAIGQCEWEGFKPYRIQLFNGLFSEHSQLFSAHAFSDATYPLNPFTFITSDTKLSAPRAENKKASQQTREFLVPTAPASSTAIVPVEKPQTDENRRKTAPGLPKATFPECFVPQLLDGIRKLKTGSFNVLVDSLFQDLKQTKVKKYAIESKVKEIAEKRVIRSSGKIWVVKADVALEEEVQDGQTAN